MHTFITGLARLTGTGLVAMLVACSGTPDMETSAATAAQAETAAVAPPAAPAFSEAAYRGHIERLSSDEFEGRAPGTPGEEKTLAYIEQAVSRRRPRARHGHHVPAAGAARRNQDACRPCAAGEGTARLTDPAFRRRHGRLDQASRAGVARRRRRTRLCRLRHRRARVRLERLRRHRHARQDCRRAGQRPGIRARRTRSSSPATR